MALKLLDLFCGAGGCSEGYRRAGFEVEGVDIWPQPNYPFKFHHMDALTFLENEDLSQFDVIHASPPCQFYSKLKDLGEAQHGKYGDHPDLVKPIRDALKKTGKPFVIENVPGAPILNSITLCGSMFGLKVYRHRIFESNVFLWQPEHHPHDDDTPPVGMGCSSKGFITVAGSGGVRGMVAPMILNYWRFAMGIDWMERKELAQAIPPAYTEWIGQQLKECFVASPRS